MLDLKQVRSFVALAAELHFGRAAQRLNMTQPPLSRQIRLLEEQLGAQLFERTSHSVALTLAGSKFLPEAQSLLQKAEEIEEFLKMPSDTPEGTVRLAFYGAASFRLLPKFMTEINKKYPKIQLKLRELNAIQQIQAFTFGELDLGIARPTVLAHGLTTDIAFRERLVAAIPENHPLASKQVILPEDLNNQSFIAYGPEAPYLHSLLQSLFAQHGITPRVTQYLSHADAVLSLVGVGLGIAIVSEHAKYAARENIVFRPLTDFVISEAITHVISRADNKKPVVKTVSDFLMEIGQTLD